jgi:phosphatidylinositol alpha-1,6-mannosyltransferase
MRQNARVMLAGLRPRGASIYHYFFAPNPVTSIAGRLQSLAARVRSVQTVCSAPASFEHARRLVFTDRLIVLSADTERRFVQAGVPPERIRLIPPGIGRLSRPDADARRVIRRRYGIGDGPAVVFPGDYEFSSAASTFADAAGLIHEAHPDAVMIFACRIKREPSREIQDRIRAKLKGLGDLVAFVNEVDDMPAFIGACDVATLPADNLFAKMDAPLVLLEAMAQGIPLVLADAPPLDELLATGAGIGVRPRDPVGLAGAISRLLADGELCRRLGEAGVAAVADRYGATRMAALVENVYDELLEG